MLFPLRSTSERAISGEAETPPWARWRITQRISSAGAGGSQRTTVSRSPNFFCSVSSNLPRFERSSASASA